MAPRAKKDPTGTPAQDGVWVAYTSGGTESTVYVFRSEIAAYRHAIDNHQSVVRVPFGSCIADAIAAPEPTTNTKAGVTE